MSRHTLTPVALLSEARPFAGLAWRLVEAQHRVSTLKLVDTLAEQALLEQVIEAQKPALPAACRDLDYLLSAPFRYRPYPRGSRFRAAGLTPGVWYGAKAVATALAEMIFYRLLFYAESPGTRPPDNAADYTAISARIATPLALDLTQGALRSAGDWTHLTDYTAPQALAQAAQAAGVGLICYTSVRDPAKGINLAVLSCATFAALAPVERQIWRIRVGRFGGQALRDGDNAGLEYPLSAFTEDTRLAPLMA